VFLAGGITDCPDWQAIVVQELESSNLILINPRRDDFDTSNKEMVKEQIRWEFKHLELAHTIAFWFPYETLCPITLYELGRAGALSYKNLIIGCHADYARKDDVIEQIALARPGMGGVRIQETFEDFIKALKFHSYL
jgi:hypothetical protein